MKELSIEDKAKRYDEAIKFAYNKHRFSSNLSEIKLIEELFPELKEDEREIPISEQKSAEEYNITGIGSKNAQGKLGEMIKRKLEIEKHCEQKPAIKLERDDNGEAVLTPFEAELFSMMSEAWQGYSFGEEVNIAKIVKEHSKELLERANEQKPAWSEEDEKLFRCAIDAVKQESKVRTDGCLDEEVGEMVINWLKAIKERVQPFLDTLEVKEVDLESEVEKCLKKYQMLAVGKKDFTCIAKHFFELALSLKNS